jgi:catechol 2,3-dioxygenase-like lactoylglutathione lyase family enzyme
MPAITNGCVETPLILHKADTTISTRTTRNVIRIESRTNRAAEKLMTRLWTIIGVADVPRSFAWYQSLLGLPATAPAHDYFGQIVGADGNVLLCLHAWGAHEHLSLTSPAAAAPGNGLLLFFRIDDFDAALPRARRLVSRLDEEPHLNPNTQTMEFSLRDPDGYYVTISAQGPA